MLKSRFGNNKFKFTNAGEKWRKKFVREFDEFGNPFLVEVGEEDILESINMWRDTVDINRIIDSCTHGNTALSNMLDINAVANILNSNGLMTNNGSYGDFVGSPKSLIEAYNMLKVAEDSYNSLSDEFKANYTDFTDYLVKGNFNDALSHIANNKVKEVVDNVEC